MSASRRVLGFDPLPIAAAGDIAHPLFVLQVPAHRFTNAGLECFSWAPAQLPLYFSCIHSVSPVMPGTILNECDQSATRLAAAAGDFVDDVANRFDDPHIALLIPTPDIICIADSA